MQENENAAKRSDAADAKAARARHTATLRHTKRLTVAALLSALSFLLGLLAKTLQGSNPLRFTLEGLPIVLSGAILGPFYGAAVGIVADLASCLMSGMTPLPLITLGSALVGLTPGLLSRPFMRGERPLATPPRFPLLLLLEGCAHTVGSLLVKSCALAGLFGMSYPTMLVLRLPIYCGVVALESTLLYLLLRSPAVRREIEREVLR